MLIFTLSIIISGKYMVFDVPMAYDYMYTAFTGVALFLVTLQILKPLNFNQNFAILQSSLKYAAATVFWYIIIFTIMLTAFGTLAYALMGPLIRDFRDLKYAYVTLFGEYLCVCVYVCVCVYRQLWLSQSQRNQVFVQAVLLCRPPVQAIPFKFWGSRPSQIFLSGFRPTQTQLLVPSIPFKV